MTKALDYFDPTVDFGGDSGGCHGDYQCLTHDLWQELSNEIRSFLDGISLSEIMAQGTVNDVQIRQDELTIR